jgi:hypothetical protein
MHAPLVVLQSVAPQVPPAHAVAQQCMALVGPMQTPCVHWLGAVHTAPSVSLGTHVPDAPGFLQ